MFQWIIGQKTGAKAGRIESQNLTIELPVRVRGKNQIDTIDLKPHFEAWQKQKAR